MKHLTYIPDTTTTAEFRGGAISVCTANQISSKSLLEGCVIQNIRSQIKHEYVSRD